MEGGLAQLGLENAQEATRKDRWGQTLGEGSSAGLGHEAVDRLRSLIKFPWDKSLWIGEEASVWRTVG